MENLECLTEEKLIAEINMLAHKKVLSTQEKEAQKKFRDEYIRRMRASLKANLDSIKYQEEKE